jgi:predicted outer membrane repeat protein
MRTQKPTIEPLEARIAPAVFTVTNILNSGQGSLRAALALADTRPGHDTILFHLPAPPTHSENIITLASQLTTDGNVTIAGPGAGKLIIDGGGTSRVLYIANTASATADSPVTISGLSIVNGSATTEGGGIFSFESLTLSGVVISGNTTTENGGGVCVQNAGANPKVSIGNSIITNNHAAGYSGGLDLSNMGSVTIRSSSVTGNVAGKSAGGINAQILTGKGGIAIIDTTVSGNIATYAGGATVADHSTSPASRVIISGSVFSNNIGDNVGTYGGGGLLALSGSTTITGSTFTGNQSETSGGGIQTENLSSLTVSGCVISNNTAFTAGDGFSFVRLNALKVTGTIITGNTANFSVGETNPGGGGYAQLQGTGAGMTFANCLISGNSADHGGGLFVTSNAANPNVKVTIAATTISGNVSTGRGSGNIAGGGGLYIQKGNTVVTGSTISGNKATYYGGGIDAYGFYSLTISKTTISGNQTTAFRTQPQGGGGAFIKNINSTIHPVDITGSHFNDNVSAYDGGGIFDEFVPLTISGSTFTRNHAVVDGNAFGGGAFAFKTTLTVTSSLFSDNIAGFAGGALAASGPGQVSISATKVTGNSAFVGGGVDLSQVDATIDHTTVSGNLATIKGGGLGISGSSTFDIKSSAITGNSSQGTGGGIDMYGGSSGSILSTIISGNAAKTSGGGIYNGSSTAAAITLQIAGVTSNTAPVGPDVDDAPGNLSTFNFF